MYMFRAYLNHKNAIQYMYRFVINYTRYLNYYPRFKIHLYEEEGEEDQHYTLGPVAVLFIVSSKQTHAHISLASILPTKRPSCANHIKI